MPKNWLRRICGVVRIDFFNFYRSIFGITGHPVKKILVLEFFLTVGCRNPFGHILFRTQIAATKRSGWVLLKNLPDSLLILQNCALSDQFGRKVFFKKNLNLRGLYDFFLIRSDKNGRNGAIGFLIKTFSRPN